VVVVLVVVVVAIMAMGKVVALEEPNYEKSPVCPVRVSVVM
jgi:hypothetical protein